MSGCDELLFEKKPCEYMPRCEVRSYAGSFNPFEVDQMSGISTPWLARGLESESQLSYSYDGRNPIPSYANNNPNNYGAMNYNNRAKQGYAQDDRYGNSYVYGGGSANAAL